MNDISQVSSNSSLVLFADDTNIFFSGNNPHELQRTICNELRNFHCWFNDNKLSLNIDKTNYVVFRNSRINLDLYIHINDKPLVRATKVKFLGVFIDSNLSWHDQVNHISSNVARAVGILSKLKFILPRNILRCVYLSLIVPHLSYCCSIWSACNKSLLNKLFILQKRAIRHITHSDPRDTLVLCSPYLTCLTYPI